MAVCNQQTAMLLYVFLSVRFFAEKRQELLSAAEDLLLSDGLILPISHPVTLNVIDLNAVKGWQLNALDIHPLKYLKVQPVVPAIPNLVLAK